jgi:hypothetical protein
MRRSILLLLMTAVTLPCVAARRITIAELEKTLMAAITAHKPDPDLVRQIGGMELSERLTESTLARLDMQLPLSAQEISALQLLADQSAFLDPPANEFALEPAPDDATQQAILQLARSYLRQMLPRLPNFLATRTVLSYDNSPQALKQGGWAVREGLHLVSTAREEISIRNDRDAGGLAQASAASQEQNGLSSWGEFGYLLGVVLTDTLHGKVTWSRWEKTSTGTIAVLQYQVPGSASHYQIIQTLNRSPRISKLSKQPNTSTIHLKAGYHGSLWIDPSTGAVSRITIEAEGKEQFRRTAVMVQYGPVTIGQSTFHCPLRSVAIYDAIVDANATLSDAATQWLNVTSFTAYHRFAATTRLLDDANAPR